MSSVQSRLQKTVPDMIVAFTMSCVHSRHMCPGAFLKSPASTVRCARFFQCELSHKSVPRFVEHFCRRARLPLEIPMQDHVVHVDHKPFERMIYLQYIRDQ